MAEDGHDDLVAACLQAPKHGLNAKALILQAAAAPDDEPARAADPAAADAAAAARRGAEFLEAVDVRQRPMVPYVRNSKIPRIHRRAGAGQEQTACSVR